MTQKLRQFHTCPKLVAVACTLLCGILPIRALAEHDRAELFLQSSQMLWRQGQRTQALEAVDKSLVLRDSGAAALEKARLLDATGNFDSAREWYQKALRLLAGQPQEAQIRLRLSLMGADDGDTHAFLTFAHHQPAEFRNRAALVLAATGHYSEALELFQPVAFPENARVRDRIRVAEWAIRAGKPSVAQQRAWEAVQSTRLSPDRLYALSLLVESHRMDGTLGRLIARFKAEENLSEEAREVWIDLLREQGHVEEALALFKAQHADHFTPAQRRELIHIYQDAGRRLGLVQEYRKLIAQEPAELGWYEGLSEYYSVAADRQAAEQVWRDFLEANGSDAALRLAGAQSMARMGFDELAVATIEKCLQGSEADALPLLALFDLHLQRGRTEQAQAALSKLDQALPPAAAARADLADAYERLNQPEAALAVWEKRAKTPGTLGYEARMRVARLYDATHQPQKALAAWHSLWSEMNTPAQRSLVEDRLLGQTAAQGQMEGLAVDLEQSLANGTASRKDSSLLVRLYTRAHLKESAIEVIQEHLAMSGGTVEALKEQSRVYRLLDDHAAYVRTSRQLITADPAHRVDYLRGIILDRIDLGGPGLASDIRRLLAQLHGASAGEAANVEFEAGVLRLAGLDDEGIAAYQRAVVEAPANGDNYLQLTDLLKKQHRTDEAVGLLQYLAEHSLSDELFIVAIDGILNTLVAELGDSRDPQAPKVSRWMRRIVLERLAQRGESPPLYRLLADVSDDAYDSETVLTATEALLAAQPQLRGATLRELVTLTAPPSREERRISVSPLATDADLSVAYGRRLIALREALPPDVYLSLGKTFLAGKDPTSAAKTFDLALDGTGLSGLLEQTAELFEKAGYLDEALERYVRAADGDQTNIELLFKVARLRERMGQYGEAHEIYAQTLAILLKQQPVIAQTSQALETRVTRPYRDFYQSLLQGYLMTWPADPAAQQRSLDAVTALVQRELESLSGKVGSEPLALHPRLDRASDFVRHVSLATGRTELADRMDAQLLKSFRQPELASRLIAERMKWGLLASARTLEQFAGLPSDGTLAGPPGDRLQSLEEVIAAAQRSGSFDTARNQSLLSGDTHQIMVVARAWAQSGDYRQAMNWADGRLDERQIADFARYVLNLVRHDPQAMDTLFEDYIATYCHLLERIESLTGQRAFTASALQRESEARELWQGKNVFPETLGFIIDHTDPQWVIGALREVSAAKRTPEVGWSVVRGWRWLLEKPLPPQASTQLAALMKEVLSSDPTMRERFYEPTGVLIGLSGLDPANIPLAREITDFWRERTGQKVDYGKPYFLLRAGQVDEALDALVEVLPPMMPLVNTNQGNFYGAIYWPLISQFMPKYAAQIRMRLDALEARSGGTAELMGVRDGLFSHELGLDANLAFLKRAVQASPGDRDYAVRLYSLYASIGYRADALRMLEQLHAADPGNMVYTAALFSGLRQYDNPTRAAAVNDAAAQDMRTPAFLRALAGKAAQLGGNAGSLPTPAPQASGPALDNDYDLLPLRLARAIEVGEPSEIRNALRAYWQTGTTISQGDSTITFRGILKRNLMTSDEVAKVSPFSGEMDLQKWLRDSDRKGEAGNLFRALAEQPFAIEEFEAYLRAVDEADRDHLSLLYGDLAQAYRHQGKARQKLEELSQSILVDTAGNHDFNLWLELALGEEPSERAQLADVLAHRLQVQSGLSQSQLLAVARLHALNGQMARATETYRLLAAKTLGMPKGDSYNGGPQFLNIMTALEFVEEIDAHLDGEHCASLVQSLLILTQPDKLLGEQAADGYAQFVMRALASSAVPQDAAAKALAIAGDITAAASPATWLDKALMEARAGQTAQAVKSLSVALQVRRPTEGFASFTDAGEVERKTLSEAHGQMLGVVQPYSDAELIARTDHIFPPPQLSWPGASAWLRSAASTVASGIEEPGTDRDLSLQMLVVMAYRLNEAGDALGAAAVSRSISASVVANPLFSSLTLKRAIDATEAIGQPLTAAAMEVLLDNGQLEIPSIASVVRRLAKEKGAAQALLAGEKATLYTENDSLLETLAALAKEAGNEERAAHWLAARKAAAEARGRI